MPRAEVEGEPSGLVVRLCLGRRRVRSALRRTARSVLGDPELLVSASAALPACCERSRLLEEGWGRKAESVFGTEEDPEAR